MAKRKSLGDSIEDRTADLAGEKEETSPELRMLNARIPESLFWKLKEKCLKERTSVQAYITNLLEKELG